MLPEVLVSWVFFYQIDSYGPLCYQLVKFDCLNGKVQVTNNGRMQFVVLGQSFLLMLMEK